jgi:hypothetical protein
MIDARQEPFFREVNRVKLEIIEYDWGEWLPVDETERRWYEGVAADVIHDRVAYHTQIVCPRLLADMYPEVLEMMRQRGTIDAIRAALKGET